MIKIKIISLVLVSGLVLASFANWNVYAQSTSTNYQINEVFIGSGGSLDASSTSYEARASLGDLGVGFSEGTLYELFGGFTTTDEEYLEFNVSAASIDLGVLSSSTTASASTNFYVRNYLSSGYVIQTVGTGFTNEGGYTMTAMSANGPASPGTEQFGMNLVANTTPSVGANPVQIPDASFSFGTASTNYNTANSFRYVVGETVAESATSTGQTNYTASYIVDINGATTPSGSYTFEQDLIVVPTF